MAWITARLADALDHAQCRDVIHGDVKPSNILLTADGNPMLLDFNLARNWSFDKTNGPLEVPGGTLDYMAPERLGAIASVGSTALDSWRSSEVEPSEGDDPHRADIYSLGIVLLEALTAASPAEAMRDRDAPARAAQKLRDLAAEYGSFRERGALAVIRAFESAAGQTIPPALRAILERCLAVRPADRYRRALELAEDLDRWRADLPLAYAAEPFWSQTLPRCARRNKKLLFAVGLALVMCLVTTYLVVSRIQSHLTLQDMAMDKLAGIWDDIESHAFQRHRVPCVPVSAPRQSPASEPGRPRDSGNGSSRTERVRCLRSWRLAAARRGTQPARGGSQRPCALADGTDLPLLPGSRRPARLTGRLAPGHRISRPGEHDTAASSLRDLAPAAACQAGPERNARLSGSRTDRVAA